MRKADKLHAYWSKRERDIVIHWPSGIQTKCDAHYLSGIFNDVFIEEMTRRGYDMNTFKFSIEPAKGNERFTSQRLKESTDAK